MDSRPLSKVNSALSYHLEGVYRWFLTCSVLRAAYLSAAVDPSKRTENTAMLSTCAMLGFVIGPTIGAFLSQIDTTIAGLPMNANNSAGLFMVVATSGMFVQTTLFFDGKDDETGVSNDRRGTTGNAWSETAETM